MLVPGLHTLFVRSSASAFHAPKGAFNPLKISNLAYAMFVIALAVVCARPAHADSVAVGYTVTDLGSGTWEYEYTLTGSLSSGDDLAIYFPLATSSNLNDLQTGGVNFTTFVFQPDPLLPADGEYDVVANIDDPSLSPVFDVSFTYSGTGTPGSQTFVLYDANYDNPPLETGETTPLAVVVSATPEPSSLLLLGSGIAGLCTLCSRRRLRT